MSCNWPCCLLRPLACCCVNHAAVLCEVLFVCLCIVWLCIKWHVTPVLKVPSFGKKEEPKFNSVGGEQMGVAKGANLLPGNGQMRMKQMAESIGVVTCVSHPCILQPKCSIIHDAQVPQARLIGWPCTGFVWRVEQRRARAALSGAQPCCCCCCCCCLRSDSSRNVAVPSMLPLR